MYKSPIDLFYDHLVTEQENEVFKAVVRCGIDVDKDELIKALAYDRRQYDLGYADGKMDANAELIRCKDCEDCTETKLYDGQRWNYCMRLRCVVKENDFCCWAERKYPKIKAKETE